MSDDLAPPRVLAAELRRAVGLLDELRDELTTAQSHATHALDDAATQRARAEAAEAECARLRELVSRVHGAVGALANSHLIREDKLQAIAHYDADMAASLRMADSATRAVAILSAMLCDPSLSPAAGEALRHTNDIPDSGWRKIVNETMRALSARDAARAAADALRAIVEGRMVPTPDDVAAHALARPLPTPGTASNGATCDEPIGLWLCVIDGEGAVVLRLAREADDQGPYLMAWSSDYGWCGTGDIRRACPLDATGRPCAWPTPALDAAGEGR